MKILFITEKFPYPLDSGGNIRTYNVLKGLAQEHEITLLSTRSVESDRDHISCLKDMCKDIICVTIKPESMLRLGAAIAKSMLSEAPLVVDRHNSSRVVKELKRLFKNNGSGVRQYNTSQRRERCYDAIHFNHLDATVYLPWVPPDTIKVLDEHNIVANQIKTSLAIERSGIKRAYMRYEQGKTERYESAICGSMDCCIVCSETDKRYLESLAKSASIVTVPNGVDIEFFSARQAESRWARESSVRKCMVFVGTLDYEPCDRGVRFFCREIFPRIKDEVPDVEFIAVGRNPSKELKSIANSTKGVRLTGWVTDVRPYVREAKLFVVPLLSGSGTRLKILDAMAMSTAVVSTSIGAEGLEIIDQRNIVIADTANHFAEASVELLRNEDKRRVIASAGNKLVRSIYSWEKIMKKLLLEYPVIRNL